MIREKENEIRLLAANQQVGETTITHCVFCGSDERKLSITRLEGGVLYNCFRASCNGKGFIPSMPSGLSDYKPVKKFTPHIFDHPTEQLDEKTMVTLERKYWITRTVTSLNQIHTTFNRCALVMPLFTNNYEIFGYQTKRLVASQFGTKAITYLEKDVVPISYSKSVFPYSPTLILVEDKLSAYRCSEFAHSAALLGTDLNDEKILDILRGGFRDIVIALDPDAVSKEIKLVNKYKLFFNSMRGASLSNDPKDLHPIQLKEELGI